MIGNIKWDVVFNKICASIEKRWDFKLLIDREVLMEVDQQTKATLEALNMPNIPNVAKVAGHVAFWIRKLKPISYAEQPPAGKLLAINELVGLLVGLGICIEYFDDARKEVFNAPPQRILYDWVVSFRVHSHSPNSSQVAFELLACI